MKQIIRFCVIGLFFLFQVFVIAQNNQIVEFVGTHIYERKITQDGVNTNNQSYVIYFEDRLGVFILREKTPFFGAFDYVYAILEEADLSMLRDICDKYLEWQKIAVQNRVKIQKDIPNSNIFIKVLKDITKQTKVNEYMEHIHFVFFSQTETLHQLVIVSDKVNSDIKFGQSIFDQEIYIGPKNVAAIRNAISEEMLKPFYIRYDKNKKQESLFN